MFKYIGKALISLRSKIDFLLTERDLKSLGYKNISKDIADKSILFSFENDRVAILNMDHDMLGYSIEATIVFSADTLSLKTVSDMNNLIFMYRCSCSGVRPAADLKVRLNLTYHMGNALSRSQIEVGMIYVQKCLSTLEMYLTERLNRTNNKSYDLSMFESIDLTGFNPQDTGERKEFIFGSWDAYSVAITEEYAGFINHPYATDALAKIEACKLFEEKNKISISEVGTWLLEDIILSRQLREISKTSYGIN